MHLYLVIREFILGLRLMRCIVYFLSWLYHPVGTWPLWHRVTHALHPFRQARAVPVVLEGRDVFAGAQTGTGKTAAFALPVLQRLSGIQRLLKHQIPVKESGIRLPVAVPALEPVVVFPKNTQRARRRKNRIG